MLASRQESFVLEIIFTQAANWILATASAPGVPRSDTKNWSTADNCSTRPSTWQVLQQLTRLCQEAAEVLQRSLCCPVTSDSNRCCRQFYKTAPPKAIVVATSDKAIFIATSETSQSVGQSRGIHILITKRGQSHGVHMLRWYPEGPVTVCFYMTMPGRVRHEEH